MVLLESVTQVVKRLAARSLAAVQHVHSRRDWLITGASIVGLGAIALPCGFRWRFLQFDTIKQPPRYLGCLVSSFFFPGVLEEWIFRVLLLPNRAADAPDAFNLLPLGISAGFSLAVFILYHLSPLHRATVFSDRRFLALAGGLGVTATIVYLTTGSLWTAAVTHWVPVAVWLLHLGGLKAVGKRS